LVLVLFEVEWGVGACCDPVVSASILPQLVSILPQLVVADWAVFVFGILDKKADSLGDGQHHLPEGDKWKHVVDEMGGSLGHVLGIATRAQAPGFARKTHQILIAARWTTAARETVGPDSALQVLSESGFDVAWDWVAVGVSFTSASQPGLQVLLNNSIEDGLLGFSGLVDAGAVGIDLLV
jgi:hypothetical protein